LFLSIFIENLSLLYTTQDSIFISEPNLASLSVHFLNHFYF